jgi:hypothetical protein
MKIIESLAGTDFGMGIMSAVIHFDHGYYWEVPATRNDAMKIAGLAEDVAGQNLDGIVYFGEYPEIAVLCGDGKILGTNFGAAYQTKRICRCP